MEKRKNYEIRQPERQAEKFERQEKRYQPEEKSTKNVPEKRFSTGAISVTIWKNTTKGKDGKDIEYKTISLQRSYKDKNDEWQHTGSLRVNDLPKASLVLNKAYEYLVLRDTETESAESSHSNEGEEYFEEIVM